MAAAVAVAMWPAIPRQTRVSFRLPPALSSLTIEYLREGDLVRSARFGWPGRTSPELLRHTVDLAPGRYEIVATLRDDKGLTRRRRGRIEADPDRIARLDLR